MTLQKRVSILEEKIKREFSSYCELPYHFKFNGKGVTIGDSDALFNLDPAQTIEKIENPPIGVYRLETDIDTLESLISKKDTFIGLLNNVKFYFEKYSKDKYRIISLIRYDRSDILEILSNGNVELRLNMYVY
jgi:hypothetical protein